MAKKLTVDDFFTGLFAALAIKKKTTISIRNDRLDSAISSVFEGLHSRAASEDLDLRFRLRVHPDHGDSIAVRDGLYNAAQRDLIGLDNPEYQDIRLKLSPEYAEKLLETLPGGRKLFLELSEEFLKHYDAVVI